MTDVCMFEVGPDRHGAIFRRVVPAVSEQDMATAEPYYERMLEVARECCPGVHEADLPYVVAAVLVRMEHEDRIYREACSRRGVLAL